MSKRDELAISRVSSNTLTGLGVLEGGGGCSGKPGLHGVVMDIGENGLLASSRPRAAPPCGNVGSSAGGETRLFISRRKTEARDVKIARGGGVVR